MIYKQGLLRWNKPGSIFLLARLVDTKAAVFEQSLVAGHTPSYLISRKSPEYLCSWRLLSGRATKTNAPHVGRECRWRETWQTAILHTPGWWKIIRRNTGVESVLSHPDLEPNEPAATPVVHEDVCVVRVLVDWTTPANSDLLVQSFERKRSHNLRHILIMTYGIWMT